MYIAGLKFPGRRRCDVQAVQGKTPLCIVSHGVGPHPHDAELGYAEHRHAHVPEVGGQGANIRRRRSLAYRRFRRRDACFAKGRVGPGVSDVP